MFRFSLLAVLLTNQISLADVIKIAHKPKLVKNQLIEAVFTPTQGDEKVFCLHNSNYELSAFLANKQPISLAVQFVDLVHVNAIFKKNGVSYVFEGSILEGAAEQFDEGIDVIFSFNLENTNNQKQIQALAHARVHLDKNGREDSRESERLRALTIRGSNRGVKVSWLADILRQQTTHAKIDTDEAPSIAKDSGFASRQLSASGESSGSSTNSKLFRLCVKDTVWSYSPTRRWWFSESSAAFVLSRAGYTAVDFFDALELKFGEGNEIDIVLHRPFSNHISRQDEKLCLKGVFERGDRASFAAGDKVVITAALSDANTEALAQFAKVQGIASWKVYTPGNLRFYVGKASRFYTEAFKSIRIRVDNSNRCTIEAYSDVHMLKNEVNYVRHPY